ncbi:YihY family inner membrane protein [Inhella gelatinilytica]|uniref:UPF0761 membrane protein I7X43_13420 n=1 Tax=Inhella gelatinilytica TaxID=2795030 RepID=A0A931J0B1_9BURK|nr:YihY family inner membrane protein [Inhella gelatinilytica]MBH9553843.1 YihY family inner membrane protein [Inhella gelatinilytica]
MHFRYRTLRHAGWLRLLAGSWRDLREWPWVASWAGVRLRFRELRLGVTAGSLTFTTLISLVPLIVLGLALFTAFPVFGAFQKALEQYFLSNLVPDSIARPVLKSLTAFAGKAKGLGTVGAIALGLSGVGLMLTIDRTLNSIWRVQRPRPMGQRVLVYWATLTLGPLLLGGSLALTSYAISASRGLVTRLPGGMETFLDGVQAVVMLLAVAALFRYVPNTLVRWRHAVLGALFVTVGLSVGKWGLSVWIHYAPSYATVYGAFATLPIFLIWVYLGWVVVLMGALVAANAPGLTQGLIYRPPGPGVDYELALGVIRELWGRQQRGAAGATPLALAQAQRVDPLQLEPVLEALRRLDWVARLEEEGAQRLVLLRNPHETSASPLLHALLVPRTLASEALWRASGWERTSVAVLLGIADRRQTDLGHQARTS